MARIQDEITTIFDGKKWRAEVPETYAAYLELSTCTEWEVSRHDCMLFRQDYECGCKRIILTNKTNKDDKYMLGYEDGDKVYLKDKRNFAVVEIENFLNEYGNDELRALNEFSTLLLFDYGFTELGGNTLVHSLKFPWIARALDAKNQSALCSILREEDSDKILCSSFGNMVRTTIREKFFDDDYGIFKGLDDDTKKRFGIDTITSPDALSDKESKGVMTATEGIAYCILGSATSKITHDVESIVDDWAGDLCRQITGIEGNTEESPISADLYDIGARGDLFVDIECAPQLLQWFEDFISSHNMVQRWRDSVDECFETSFREYIDTLDTKFDLGGYAVYGLDEVFHNDAWAGECTFGVDDLNECMRDWYTNFKGEEE